MTLNELQVAAQEARAAELAAADQLQVVLDHVANALAGAKVEGADLRDLGKLALELHARLRDRAADAEKAATLARKLDGAGHAL